MSLRTQSAFRFELSTLANSPVDKWSGSQMLSARSSSDRRSWLGCLWLHMAKSSDQWLSREFRHIWSLGLGRYRWRDYRLKATGQIRSFRELSHLRWASKFRTAHLGISPVKFVHQGSSHIGPLSQSQFGFWFLLWSLEQFALDPAHNQALLWGLSWGLAMRIREWTRNFF